MHLLESNRPHRYPILLINNFTVFVICLADALKSCFSETEQLFLTGELDAEETALCDKFSGFYSADSQSATDSTYPTADRFRPCSVILTSDTVLSVFVG